MSSVTSTSLPQSSLPLSPNQEWNRVNFTAQKVEDLVATIFIDLVRDYQRRELNYKNDLTALNRGPWYASTYARILKEEGMEERYRYLRNKNRFFTGLSPKGFSQTKNKNNVTGKAPYNYFLNKGVKPSEALENITTTLSFMDCTQLIQVAYYKALAQILGQSRFNSYFSAEGGHKLRLLGGASKAIQQTPLNDFVETTLPLSYHQIRKGDNLYFGNHPNYHSKHPLGYALGYHVIAIEVDGTQKYTGFGLNPDGLTGEEMIDLLVEEFNEPPIKPDLLFSEEVIGEKSEEDHLVESLQKSLKTVTISREVFHTFLSENPHIVGLRPFVVARLSPAKIANHLD